MEPFLKRLAQGEVLLADGAMGTMLMQRGLKPGACPEALVLDNPSVLKDIARAYLDAGADIVQTDTFGGSPLKLAEYGLADRAEDINRRAAEIALAVVEPDGIGAVVGEHGVGVAIAVQVSQDHRRAECLAQGLA